MKKSALKIGFCVLLAAFASMSFAQERPAWSGVKSPEITKIELTKDNPKEITVSFNLLTSNDGADKGSVDMISSSGEKVTNVVGKTRREAKTTTFTPEKSGTYTFVVYGDRKGESSKIKSAEKSFSFSYPLEKPTLSLLNLGNGTVSAKWNGVKEADGYVLSYTDADGKKVSLPKTTSLTAQVTGLKPGSYSDMSVTATRGAESVSSDVMHKLILKDKEREWFFTEYGTSTDESVNTCKVLDSNNLKVTLNSCTFDAASEKIATKGGKFTAYFDGISYYYTVIDPAKESFELSATVHVDYHNPMADGQEGFGIVAYDRIGERGEKNVIPFNNSAGVISWKYTTHVNGAKKEIKDGLGARFVSGITPEVLKKGETAITENAVCKADAFSYDASYKIRSGNSYRITLKKDNTGYHAIYRQEIPSEDTVEEYIMYDPSKLTQLDKDHVYVGFVVARGCNATFSDVEFKITDPKKDPPAQEEPPELVPLAVSVDSPTTWYDGNYPFAFTSNAEGTIRIEATDEITKKTSVLVSGETVSFPAKKTSKKIYYKKTLKISKTGFTNLQVTFTPKDGWRPEPKQVIAQFNRETNKYEQDYKSVSILQSVITKSYKGKEIYASKDGSAFGDGTKANPLTIEDAIAYCKPGQTVVLMEGTYYPTRVLNIQKGNSGTAKARKYLRPESGKRVVLDMSALNANGYTGAAFEIRGDYWTIENIDVTKSAENLKGIQVFGSYNVLNMVDTYMNGDTGIQIAGAASDEPSLWPHDNLIYGCESFGNADPAENNADGFAAKLTAGSGNVFRNCVAHHNVDDGWDLYAKTETGPIGAVLLENCIAYSNGRRIDGSGHGDGNGFKLGGEGIPVRHRIYNSVSFNNDLNGITTNSNPALIVDHVTTYGNKAGNIAMYGKGKLEDNKRTYETHGVLSLRGGSRDNSNSIDGQQPFLEGDDNYFFNGAQAINKSKSVVDDSIFVSVDYSKIEHGLNSDGSFNRLSRSKDGVFELGNLFKLNEKAPLSSGADYNYSVRGKNKK